MRPSDVLRERVKKLRTTQEELAKALEGVGANLKRRTLSKIESGERKVTVDEAVELAAALNVAPVHLLVPLNDDATVELTPGMEVPAFVARRWFRGHEPLPYQDARSYVTQVPKAEFDFAEKTKYRLLRQYVENLPYRSDIPDERTMLTDIRDLADGLLNPRYMGVEELIQQQKEREEK